MKDKYIINIMANHALTALSEARDCQMQMSDCSCLLVQPRIIQSIYFLLEPQALRLYPPIYITRENV